ncbi:signal peptidase I [Leucobacter albus]|uniref:Signal peptidase I n=1 Tax=Leucobacter albus TaxID=272210 RepID=A0ABW3TN69_9MICO
MAGIRSVVLWIGATLGVVCIALFAAGLVFGIKPYVVVSGSMEPEMPVGALALARAVPAVKVDVGDIVTVPRTSGAGVVTHRVVATDTDENGAILLTLKGDANLTNDPDEYRVATVGKHLATVPGLGYVAGSLRTPFGLVGVSIVVLVFALAVFVNPRARAAVSPARAAG